ncbi:pectate lyase [uncultured Duncaniella sp.]|uniref:pectate lyase n=1 Tax=uncultured Duncaniella sp. TaxID=2768039 RepID=UPI0025AA04EA|nr:pectate lyase [uncultured Duncaniella sp.]
MKKLLISVSSLLLALGLSASESAPAFPGAEGHGRYVTGGRGGEVRHVTNLNDSGPGSLRQALSGTAPKIIVFDVSGYIDLRSQLNVTSNTTIAGQTAPEGGITLRYYTLYFGNCDNVIVRFIRSRRSQVKDVNDGADATWGRNRKNIIIDHCSFSWSIDEVASFYDNRNFTLQWSTIAEGLANPGHTKGAHSYGGIWGGKNASFHHNFVAHIQNRAPRFNGARYAWDGYDKTVYSSTVDAERVDFRNCLMYNWGNGNGCYGGPGGGYVNMVNNYYKAGPGTKNKTRVTQVSVASDGNAEGSSLKGYASRYYINGNYVTAASNPEDYDWSGVIYDGGLLTLNGERYIADAAHLYGENVSYVNINDTDCVSLKLDEQIDPGEVTTHSATDVYDKILDYCGASLYRDDADIRYMEETRTGTTTYKGNVAYVDANGKSYPTSNTSGILDFINAPDGEQNPKTASFPELPSNTRQDDYDSDGDGIPDVWEVAQGLNPNDGTDGKIYTLDPRGWYTNVEVYINSLVEPIMKAGNMDAISAVDEYYPKINLVESGIKDTFVSGQIERIEYYNLQGIRLSEPDQGVSIRRTVYTDGKIVTDKVVK